MMRIRFVNRKIFDSSFRIAAFYHFMGGGGDKGGKGDKGGAKA